jgi:hypothetical protein
MLDNTMLAEIEAHTRKAGRRLDFTISGKHC